MEKININLKILDALGLSLNERKVFETLLNTQMASSVARIAERSGVPRTTTIRVLKELRARGLIKMVEHGARNNWMYKKGLERF